MTKTKKAWNSLMYKLMFKNYECECENKNKKWHKKSANKLK